MPAQNAPTPAPEIVDPEAVRRVHAHPLADGLAGQLAATFKALADPTRVRMLHALSHAELCVGDLAAVLEMSESAVSHQLRLLRSLRVVRARWRSRSTCTSRKASWSPACATAAAASIWRRSSRTTTPADRWGC